MMGKGESKSDGERGGVKVNGKAGGGNRVLVPENAVFWFGSRSPTVIVVVCFSYDRSAAEPEIDLAQFPEGTMHTHLDSAGGEVEEACYLLVF